MALVKCAECGAASSDLAKACACCGVPPPKLTAGCLPILLALIALAIIAFIVFAAMGRKREQLGEAASSTNGVIGDVIAQLDAGVYGRMYAELLTRAEREAQKS